MNSGTSWRRPAALVTALAVVVAALIVVLVTRSKSGHSLDSAQHISVANGVQVAAEVFSPPGRTERHPLVVMPAGWGVAVSTYRVLARHIAASDYDVVVYSQRGQVGSSGDIDDAGPATVSDVSRVIDWAGQHLDADVAEVGMWGTSYGAGVSLLAAAHDSRIRTVVATSTWTDLAQSLTPNDTVATQTLTTLFTGARLDPALSAVRNLLGSDPTAALAPLQAMSPARSPMTYVRQLNRNHPAIMLANAFEDQYFGPRQLVAFYSALTTPKRLELQGGAHGGPGYPGIVGKRDAITDDGLAWLDRYLRGRQNGIDAQAPVRLRDVVTGQWRTYSSWPAVRATDVFDLDQPGAASIGQTPASWTAGITAGADSAATSGTGATYPPVQASLGALNAQSSISWTGPPVPAAVALTGTLELHVDVTSSSPDATFFIHVYDVTPTGQSSLMSFTPWTSTALTQGLARSIDIGLQPIAWTVPVGDRVGLVIDTVDPRYNSLAPAGTTIQFGSVADSPATLTLPVG